MVLGHESPSAGRGRRVDAGWPVALLACLCCSWAVTAHAGYRYAEYGVAVRGLVGGRDDAGPGLGADFSLCLLNQAGGPGLRAVVGASAFDGEHVKVSGTFIVWPVSGTYFTEQTMTWFALGPAWSFPSNDNRSELYVLAGAASTAGSGAGPLVNISGTEPGGTRTWISIAGATWSHRLARSALMLELGGELQLGGRGTFWGSPPLVSDGPGSYHFRTRRASIRGVAVRCGLRYERCPRK